MAKALYEAGEKLLGKGKGAVASMMAQKLGKRSADLQEDIRKLKAKEKLSAEEKAELSEMQAELKDIKKQMASESVAVTRKGQSTSRARKMKDKVTLSEAPFDYNKGGMARKKYNKGGYANCGASMKATQKSTKMAYGGMARKK